MAEIANSDNVDAVVQDLSTEKQMEIGPGSHNDPDLSPPRSLMPPFSSNAHSHLPTPQSPNSLAPYFDGDPYSPQSPLSQGSKLHGRRPSNGFSLHHSRDEDSTDETVVRDSSRAGQMMTPDSSPFAARTLTPRNPIASSVARSPVLSFQPVTVLSGLLHPGTQSTLGTTSRSGSSTDSISVAPPGLSSPFRDKIALSDGKGDPTAVSRGRSLKTSAHDTSDRHGPVHLNDIFTDRPVQANLVYEESLKRPQDHAITALVDAHADVGHLEEEKRLQHIERRRPDYLKRERRSPLAGGVAAAQSNFMDEQDNELYGVGITVTPMRGRRLKLFQETSEESFEESLMAGGYGRYRTSDWLQQPTPGPPGPSNLIPMLEAEAAPSEKELKKRKRLAAFRESTNNGTLSSKLRPVEIDGKGRVLLDADSEEYIVHCETSNKKRTPRRRKKGSWAEVHSKDGILVEHGTEYRKPDWPDEEFPWSVRLEERSESVKAEETEKMKWIEKFFDRESDEDEENEEEIIPSAAWGQVYEDPPMPSRRGRGKMVPLKADPRFPPSLQSRPSAFFPSDPADARAALLSKRSVRLLSSRDLHPVAGQLDARRADDESICICGGRDDGRELVQCDGCQTWYHLQCIGVKNVAELGSEDDPWFCIECQTSPPEALTPKIISEPTFAPTDHGNSGTARRDPLFYQAAIQDSPVPVWSTSRPPKTPTRSTELSSRLPSHPWSTGVITPYYYSEGNRAHTTPGLSEGIQGRDEVPFDPTSTPSRGIKVGPSFATPKITWTARSSGVFQTPLRPFGSASLSRVTKSNLSSSVAGHDGSGVTSQARHWQAINDSPTRQITSGESSRIKTPADVRRVLEFRNPGNAEVVTENYSQDPPAAQLPN